MWPNTTGSMVFVHKWLNRLRCYWGGEADSCGPNEPCRLLDRGAHWRHLANMIKLSCTAVTQPDVKLYWQLVNIRWFNFAATFVHHVVNWFRIKFAMELKSTDPTWVVCLASVCGRTPRVRLEPILVTRVQHRRVMMMIKKIYEFTVIIVITVNHVYHVMVSYWVGIASLICWKHI